MQNFTYYTPTKVVFGKETVTQLPALLREFGARKVLIHYGQGSVVRSGLLARVRSLLDEAGLAHAELGGVVPNPRLSLVYEGIALAKREGVDLILAVGGGSVIDSAKAIGYGVVNEGDVWDFYAHTREAKGCLPVAAVLTLSATGSEMSNSSVLTKEDGWLKRGYNADWCRPKFAILDPTYTETLPAYQTACGCTDILMHTLERYFAKDGSMALTDAIAEGLLRTVMASARVLQQDPKNYDARAEIMWAGSLSHNGLTGCGSDGGDWVCHRMEHEMGGLWDVAHGAGLAAIWGSWARFTYRENLDRFYRFATQVMGIAPNPASRAAVALEGIEALEHFFREIGMPTSFHDLNLAPTDEELSLLAKKYALAVGGAAGSAVKIGETEARAIYRMAL